MRILTGDVARRKVRQLEARGSDLESLEPAVRNIIADIRKTGDRALRIYAEKWDGLKANEALRVSQAELETAWAMSAPEFKSALRLAAARIRRFCIAQRLREWQRTAGGITTGQVVRPLESVGCYVPGGRHPLVSTLLMTVVPAQVAGVKRICVVSPNPKREVLAAAHMLGVSEVFRVGGAQAVAALAYGTQSVPRVDKIVGPGNSYVTAAKKLVSFDCSIDLLAGPTEALIFSNRGRSEFIAAEFAIARRALNRRGAVLLASSREEAISWANRIAPEHITVEPGAVAGIHNAGSIFVGDYSAQAAGDYASGPNHVLPTGGAARFRGGLSVNDFLKVITVQDLSRKGLSRISKAVTHLAKIEGLTAHAESIRVRCAHA